MNANGARYLADNKEERPVIVKFGRWWYCRMESHVVPGVQIPTGWGETPSDALASWKLTMLKVESEKLLTSANRYAK